MGKLGIIGGMGPAASQLFYKAIIERTDAACDQQHIDIILLSHASMPDRTEAIESGDVQPVLDALTQDAKLLEEQDVSAIAIPCNTSHYFLDEIQPSVHVPILNMVRETVLYLQKVMPHVKKVGVLATDGTMRTGIYKKECERCGLEYAAPSDEMQKLVMEIIYNQIKKGGTGNMEDFQKIEQEMRQQGCDAVVLACTELSCFKEYHALDAGFYIDALDILVEKSIRICGGKLKEKTL